MTFGRLPFARIIQNKFVVCGLPAIIRNAKQKKTDKA